MSGNYISTSPEINYVGIDEKLGTPPDIDRFIDLALGEPSLALLALSHYGKYGNAAASFKYGPLNPRSPMESGDRQSSDTAARLDTEIELAAETKVRPVELDERVRAAAGIIATLFSGRSDLNLQFDPASQDALEADVRYAGILAAGRANKSRQAQADPRGVVSEARLFPIRYILQRVRQYNEQGDVRLGKIA